MRTPEDVDRAEAYFKALGCRTERQVVGSPRHRRCGAGRIRSASRYEFSTTCSTSSVWLWRCDLYTPGALVRLDHFNQIT
ncbi:hypothetical protein M8494_24805 [Serratia ureilytica]